MQNNVPVHQTYQIVAIDERGIPNVIEWAGSYNEAERKQKWVKENHVAGGNFKTHSGKRVGTGRVEIRRTLVANSTRYSAAELAARNF